MQYEKIIFEESLGLETNTPKWKENTFQETFKG